MQLIQKTGQEPTEKNLITQLWFKYFPYWPIFLLVLLLCATGAWFYLRNATPIYESSASILIKDEKRGSEDSKIFESLNILSAKKIIENEIEVFHSRALMKEVVKELNLYAPVFEKSKIKWVSAYSTSPIAIVAKKADSLQETEKIYFRYDKDSAKVVINDRSYSLNQWVNTQYGVLKFIPQLVSDSLNTSFYFSLISPIKITSALVKILKVEVASKLSSIINLKLRDDDPKRADNIINGLIDIYNTVSVKDKNILATNTLDFLDERLELISNDIDSVERKIQSYKTSTGSVDISSQGQLYLDNVNVSAQRLSDVGLQLTVLDQVENYVKSKSANGGIVPSTVGVNDPLLTQLLNKLYDTELEYEKLKKTSGLNSPTMISLAEEIKKAKPSILEEINNHKKTLEATQSNINSSSNKYSSMLSAIPKKERDLVEISREQNIKSATYNFLLQKREEAALALSSSVTNIRVIDKAQSNLIPVSPNPKKIYLIALAFAFVLVIGLITAKEMFNRTVLFRHEIENHTSIPIIAEIIHQKSKDSLVIGTGKRTFIAEQFRNLRTSLPYIGIRGPRKKILVTSTIAGDGKSFIVANLGLSLAMTNKKVIVLEFDLSNPTLSDKLEVTQSKGLSEYLSKEAEYEEIIQRTTINENLFIISAGQLPDNPSDLIVSSRVNDLMDYLALIFDYIIIDTAPVGLLSDAYVLSAYCDATLYIIRHRHTPKVAVERLDANNKINELKNMAIVFNGVKARGFGQNGYGYGYGYGYIYKKNKKNVVQS